MTILKAEQQTQFTIALHLGNPITATVTALVDGTDWSTRMTGLDIELTPAASGSNVMQGSITTTINGQMVTLQGPISMKVTVG